MPAWDSLVGSANGHPQRNSYGSTYLHTVLRTGTHVDAASVQSDHSMVCDGCAQLPKPVNQPLVLQAPLPQLYKKPAVPADGMFNLADLKGDFVSLRSSMALG
ncbi:hypothetical protein L226DRAFT_576209 [Lentinus tigrinus ALCF2SS1-7]|uniref:Uncharacterized protein n=1 Tax=Lentinus tigrinus ALCF2SS1-6 TaxID=1328759 RepID=A0A5C2RT86_9APHY|nr:hypothetical protein L227DRAFT_616992 [Lentinus tigrinus ALCF2SS1-6]RPD68651.1 hypothetical protein L226DRAFT_576209 [Lentinus tigrinus ALCF2SS1-7]